jgi:hypothetical protein
MRRVLLKAVIVFLVTTAVAALVKLAVGLFVGFFLVAVLFRLDYRAALAPGLVLLAITALVFAREGEARADGIAAYAYGFLATGVVAGIVTSRRWTDR